MAATRASARLAMRNSIPEVDKTDKPPPRKVRRRARSTKRRRSRKKQIPSLDGFVDLPLDIFTVITMYLYPADIISLSRSCKAFRSILMRRSSKYIWTNTMNNVQNLPPPPPDMSELSYLTLLFSRYCTGCGVAVVCRMYEELRMRLCVTCCKTHLVTLDILPLEIRDLVPNSIVYPPNYGRWMYNLPARETYTFALKKDTNRVNDEFRELQKTGDANALETWRNERIKTIDQRRTEAYAIYQFLQKWRCRPRTAR